MSINSTTNSLRAIRESLNVTQETVARRTSVTNGTYLKAENGHRVRNDTAMQILVAINSILAEQGKEPVTLEQLGLNLY